MADKSFGVTQLDILGSGEPTISAPDRLKIDSHNVAISTSLHVGAATTIGGDLYVSGVSTFAAGGFVDIRRNVSITGIATINAPYNTNAQVAWTVTNNSASAYRFTGPGQDGTEDNPDLYLVRGQRYVFKHEATSSHPLQIRVSNGGSAYNDGVTNNGQHSTNITFNVQHDAPAQLVYQCTSHGGMVGNIYIVGQHLANGADNRVLTATSAYGMNGESTLTYDNPTLEIDTTSSYGTLKLDGSSGGLIEFKDDGTRKWELYGAVDFSFYDRANTKYGLILKSGGDVEVSDGNLVVANGHGIDFSATGGPASGTGGSELLDDYEEGSFSPAWFDDGGVFVSSYSVQYGQYTKIGNVVYFCFGLRIGSFSRTPNSGQFCRVGNLPFVSRVVGDDQEPVFNLYARLWGSGTPPETAWIRQSSGGSGSNHVEFYMDESQTGNDHQLVGADFDTSSSCRVVVNGFYFTS